MASEKTFLADMGDLDAPKGSLAWCIGVREQARFALNNAKTTRQETQAWIAALKSDSNFQKLTDRDGHGFLTWEAFCEELPPYGFGMSVEEVEALIESKSTAQVMAGDPRVEPLANKPGNPTGNNQYSEETLQSNNSSLGNSAEYIVRRLKRDRPDIAEALARGEYKSARQAGIAAGIVKVPTSMELAQKAYLRLSAHEREKFCEWLAEQD